MKQYIIGIRFNKVGKIYHFDASKHRHIKIGDYAVVDTTHGRQLGLVAQIYDGQIRGRKGSRKPILRKANPRDLVLRTVWQNKEIEAVVKCRAKVADMKIAGIKIVSAEFSFDGKGLTFFFSAEGDERVDMKSLRKVMQRSFPRSRVDMRQVGSRDVAKIIGGMGACGMEIRCCSMFLTEFSPISIKMAKAQGISLSPSEITGMCGRLRCCLIYEYKQYLEAKKELPNRGVRVVTPLGEGRVIDVYLLKRSMKVDLGKSGVKEFVRDDVQTMAEIEALRRATSKKCEKHKGERCDCPQNPN